MQKTKTRKELSHHKRLETNVVQKSFLTTQSHSSQWNLLFSASRRRRLRCRIRRAQLRKNLQHAVKVRESGTKSIHKLVHHEVTVEKVLAIFRDLFGQLTEKFGLHLA